MILELLNQNRYRNPDYGNMAGTGRASPCSSSVYSHRALLEPSVTPHRLPRYNWYALLRMKAPFLDLIWLLVVYSFLANMNEGWRWSYYVNAILSFISFVGLFISYFPPTYHQLHNQPTKDPPVKDWFGLTAFTLFIALLSLALGWGKLIWGELVDLHAQGNPMD